MKFCSFCGNQLEDNARFCTACGQACAPAQQPSQTPPETAEQPYNNPAGQAYNPAGQQQGAPSVGQSVSDAFHKFNDTDDTTASFDPNDIQQNKVLAVLSYFGILCLIPLLAGKNSPFARFHAGQGLTLFLIDIAYGILSALLGLIKVPSVTYLFGIPYQTYATPWFVSLIIFLVGIPLLVLAILGIVNAATGKAKELPLIGKIRLFR
ncbi:MAG: zinc-ribbon domain-containing protein [Acutalibacteraceae bacterium]